MTPRHFKFSFLLALVLAVAAVVEPQADAKAPWLQLEKGLELGTFVSPQPSEVGDSLVHILRIDPGYFELRLLNASAPDQSRRQSAREWALNNGLVAAINASLYQADNRTSASLMRTRDHVNNRRLSKDKTILAFDPLDPSLPKVQIIDRECQDFDALNKQYQTLVQSIRMVSCDGQNVWAPQSKKWSVAAIGMDKRGRVLFIHSRSPHSTHDLIDVLLQLSIDLRNAMYVEGGPVAQLYARSGDKEFEFLGSYSTGSNENDNNAISWPVPNVVGVVRVNGKKP
ncbi:MAG: phosphodiester glycosidase family protein [Nitrospinae bacterium]|nr:phosphodiester glycosidase family protein [Nitrospinota bacterium]